MHLDNRAKTVEANPNISGHDSTSSQRSAGSDVSSSSSDSSDDIDGMDSSDDDGGGGGSPVTSSPHADSYVSFKVRAYSSQYVYYANTEILLLRITSLSITNQC